MRAVWGLCADGGSNGRALFRADGVVLEQGVFEPVEPSLGPGLKIVAGIVEDPVVVDGGTHESLAERLCELRGAADSEPSEVASFRAEVCLPCVAVDVELAFFLADLDGGMRGRFGVRGTLSGAGVGLCRFEWDLRPVDALALGRPWGGGGLNKVDVKEGFLVVGELWQWGICDLERGGLSAAQCGSRLVPVSTSVPSIWMAQRSSRWVRSSAW